jgi:CRISPR-associated protein Csh2
MISKNSEILFLYDAQSCNPNGDMDNENKPRMDYDTSTNLVSDVRLKRYIRDYLEAIKTMEIFVTGSVESAKERSKQLKNMKIKHTDLVDVRMFGVVTAEEDIVGGHMTGPIQFTWGYSLHCRTYRQLNHHFQFFQRTRCRQGLSFTLFLDCV